MPDSSSLRDQSSDPRVTPEMVDKAREILMRSGEIRNLPHYRVQAALELALERPKGATDIAVAEVEAAVDDLTDRTREVLGMVPACSWSAFVLVTAHDMLRNLANHVAAFGLGEVD